MHGVAFKFNRHGVARAIRLNLANAEVFVRRVNFKIGSIKLKRIFSYQFQQFLI